MRVGRIGAVVFLASLNPSVAWAQSQSPAQGQAQGVETKLVMFEAPSVGRTLAYRVALPAGYESGTKRYPVLYLLHGYSGNYMSWVRHRAPETAHAREVIVVFPDCGNSWFINWAESDEGQKNAWDDYITKDLIGHVDSHFRTIARREGRAINGLSMGGFGALAVGLRHPDMFCAVGSHSGALSYARAAGERLRKGVEPTRSPGNNKPSEQPNPLIGVAGFRSQAERTPKGIAFRTPEQADASDPFKLVLAIPRDKLPHIYVDCGTEDTLLKDSREFVQLLIANNIPFTYAESAGEHNGRYWSREFGQSLAVQLEMIRRHAAASSPTPSERAKTP